MKKNKGIVVIIIFIIIGVILFGYLGYRVKNDFFKGSERKKLDSIELYGYTLSKNDTEIYDGRKVICGYSCIDYDRLMVFEDKARFEVGDKIIYEKVGAYSMTFDGAFIRYFLDVYVEKDGEVEQVRHRMSVEAYLKIQS